MQIILSIIALIFLVVILRILITYLWQSFQTQRKGLPPYINTYPRQRHIFRDKLHLKKGSSLLDLGCGDGTMLRLLTKRFHLKKAVVYDINTFAIRQGRWMNKLHGEKHITLIHNNIYNANVKGFDYIYLYLFPDFIAEMEDRLFERIDPGTVIICNTFHFKKHTPIEIITDKNGKEIIFLYKSSLVISF